MIFIYIIIENKLKNIYQTMSKALQKFKIQLILRDQKQKKKKPRKLSIDYNFKSPNKPTQESQSPFVKRIFRASTKIQKNVIIQQPKQKQAKVFQQKIQEYVNKKRITLHEQKYVKINNFNTMLQNIKIMLKENQKKDKQSKTIEQQQLINDEFQCVRSQIHQLYSSQDKIQLYRMLRNSQSKNNVKKSGKNEQYIQQQLKNFNNPFFTTNTVVCFKMSLNNPQMPNKKPLFQAPLRRPSTSMDSSKKIVTVSSYCKQRPMSFKLNNDYDNQYNKKIKSFLQFLFKINYSNNIYVNLQIQKVDQNLSQLKKYTAYIGKGNNSLLIKSLLKRRFWWQIVENYDNNVDFYWSQNIIDTIQQKQQKTNISHVPQISKQSIQKSQSEHDLHYVHNLKILPIAKAKKVEKLITSSGFSIPYSENYQSDLITNHIPRNYCIGSKKNLYKSLLNFFTNYKMRDPFNYIPKTYHITSIDDAQFQRFYNQNKKEPQKVWIVKPGENTNRGNGINLSTFKSITQLLKKSKHTNGQQFTYIVQSYINKPFLYNNRKFDIRHYMMITSVNGIIKAYWYREGYIRTSSQVFDLQDLDNSFIHLTNDAIQRQSEDYQKYEPANKLSYTQFQRYLDYSYPGKNLNLQRDILPKMKQMATYIIQANYQILDHKRNQNNFQIFGLDFMIDRQFKPWLIEVNYNPCLEINCPVLQRIIPSMVQNSFRIGLDPLYPPTSHFPVSKRYYLSDNYLKNLKYELIFDEESLTQPITNNFDFKDQKEIEEQYLDQGKELNEIVV